MILVKEVCKLYIACCMLQTLAYCAVTSKIFRHDDSVNGRVCPNIERSFTKKADRIIVCSFHCSLDPSCKSLFYGRTSGICYGCSDFYTVTSTLDNESNTVYYKDQEPDEQVHNVTNVRFSTVDGYSHRGRVEVLYNGTWGTVCNENWRGDDVAVEALKNKKVLCGMFGYSNGTVLSRNDVQLTDATSLPIWIEFLSCKGTETSIFDCPFPGFGQDFCDHGEDLVVHCHD